MLVGATRMKTETLPTSIYLNMATGDTGPAMASALILLLISALSLFLSALLDKKTTVSRRIGKNEVRTYDCSKKLYIAGRRF